MQYLYFSVLGKRMKRLEFIVKHIDFIFISSSLYTWISFLSALKFLFINSYLLKKLLWIFSYRLSPEGKDQLRKHYGELEEKQRLEAEKKRLENAAATSKAT